ncbi:MAG: T9SS type A sorting domain-containing protein [Saprospiraceae bacterium]
MIKNILLPLYLFLCPIVMIAQPSIEWQKTFGGSKTEEARQIQLTHDGGYIVAGIAGSSDGDVGATNGYHDFWVLKLDSIGTVQWKKLYGGSDLDFAFAIQQTTDRGFVVAGFTRSNDGDVSGNHGDYDAWVLKLDSIGGIQWQKCLGGSSWEEAWDIQQTTDGGYIVAGRSGAANGDVTVNHGSLDYWVVKLSSTGQIEWQKSLGGGLLDLAYSVSQTMDGGYIVAGESNSPDGDVSNLHGSFDYWVVKLNFEGKIEWQKTLGGAGLDRANDIHQTKDGGYIVAGQARSSGGDVTGSHGGYDFWVVKLNETGSIEWQKALGGTAEDYGSSIHQTNDDGYVVIGQTQSNNGDVLGNDGGADLWVVKLTDSGEIQWQKTLGGTMAEHGFSIQQTNDSGYILAGESWSSNGDLTENKGETDLWIVKLSPESSSTFETYAGMLKLYPNPAAQFISLETTSVELTLRVQITDLLGRELSRQTIQNGGSANIASLPSGFYLLTATTSSGKVFSGKFRKQE